MNFKTCRGTYVLAPRGPELVLSLWGRGTYGSPYDPLPYVRRSDQRERSKGGGRRGKTYGSPTGIDDIQVMICLLSHLLYKRILDM